VVLLVFQWLGHWVGVTVLQLTSCRAIGVFATHWDAVPIADRVNGDWILEVPDLGLNPGERAALEANYQRLSPCLYDSGYCYFELGGFLSNSGGYAYKVSENAAHNPGNFGFTRIESFTRIIGNWYFYW
jgi:hypothetical protein